MAFGGGEYVTYNKILPGTYINFVSAARASVHVGERGYAAIALELDWGPDEEIFTVENGEFQTETMKIFGYDYSNEKMKKLRDLFMHAQTAHLYRLNGGGVKASNEYAVAKYSGTRGNDITIIVKTNIDEEDKKDVITMLGSSKMDIQTVEKASELKANDFVEFKDSKLTPTAGTKLSGGTNKDNVTGEQHQKFLDLVESYNFNILGCNSSETVIKKLYAQYTKRMRDEVGIKFQCVIHQLEADYEGVINVQNEVLDDDCKHALVFWLTGAEASCAVNKSLTNKEYNGDYKVNVTYTQSELKKGLVAGQFLFHSNNGKPYTLSDVSSLTTETIYKNGDFKSNQVIRVLDQIGNDIALLFNGRHLGNTQNNEAGREGLWKDIVGHHQELERIQALENFDPKAVKVEKGLEKKSVIVTDPVSPVACMEQLYMTVVVK